MYCMYITCMQKSVLYCNCIVKYIIYTVYLFSYLRYSLFSYLRYLLRPTVPVPSVVMREERAVAGSVMAGYNNTLCRLKLRDICSDWGREQFSLSHNEQRHQNYNTNLTFNIYDNSIEICIHQQFCLVPQVALNEVMITFLCIYFSILRHYFLLPSL